VASGEVATVAPGRLAELPRGFVVTTSGRISGVTEPGEVSVTYPFPVKDLVFLDDALTYGSRTAKARFAVYLGDLGEDTAAGAREILAKVPTPENAVLLAVSPNQRAIEVVYGSDVQGRGIEQAAPQPDGRPAQRRAGAERRGLPTLRFNGLCRADRAAEAAADLHVARQEGALVEPLSAHPGGDLVVALARVARSACRHHIVDRVPPAA
jgi:hypothetical protein